SSYGDLSSDVCASDLEKTPLRGPTGTERHRWRVPGGLGSVVFSRDGQHVLAAGFDFVVLLESATGRVVREYTGHAGGVYEAVFKIGRASGRETERVGA